MKHSAKLSHLQLNLPLVPTEPATPLPSDDEVQRAPDLLHTVKQEVDRRRREVDFILEQDGKLVALEVKMGSTVS